MSDNEDECVDKKKSGDKELEEDGNDQAEDEFSDNDDDSEVKRSSYNYQCCIHDGFTYTGIWGKIMWYPTIPYFSQSVYAEDV